MILKSKIPMPGFFRCPGATSGDDVTERQTTHPPSARAGVNRSLRPF